MAMLLTTTFFRHPLSPALGMRVVVLGWVGQEKNILSEFKTTKSCFISTLFGSDATVHGERASESVAFRTVAWCSAP